MYQEVQNLDISIALNLCRSFMVAAENEMPYICSTLEFNPSAERPYPEWEGEFDEDMDLTFGIGHSIRNKI